MGLEGMEAIGCHETGCMNPPSPLKPPSPPNLTGVDCISYLFFSCLLLISNHFQNQGGKISRNCSSHDFPLLGDLHLAEIRFKGEKRVFEADKCFVCVSHWSFLPSLGDRRHNVEWSGGTAASSEERKVKAMQPLWKCNLSSSSNLKTHVKRERGAFPIGLLSKARMTAVTHCEVLGRGSLTLSTSTSTLLDLTNNTLHSTQECSSCQICHLSIGMWLSWVERGWRGFLDALENCASVHHFKAIVLKGRNVQRTLNISRSKCHRYSDFNLSHTQFYLDLSLAILLRSWTSTEKRIFRGIRKGKTCWWNIIWWRWFWFSRDKFTHQATIGPVSPPAAQITPKCHCPDVIKITWSADMAKVPRCVRVQPEGAPSCAPRCCLLRRLRATDVRRLEGRKRRAAPPSIDVGGAPSVLQCSWIIFRSRMVPLVVERIWGGRKCWWRWRRHWWCLLMLVQMWLEHI